MSGPRGRRRRRSGAPVRLRRFVAALHRAYGDPFLPPVADPFALILWEQVAYLASDARRAEAFARLQAEVGLTPAAVAGADPAVLRAIARTGGGTAVSDRADRMGASATVVETAWGGDLSAATGLPYRKARTALTAFPMIGPPGADKILMLSGARPVLALDSNAMRVLLRLGYGTETSDYQRTYDSVQAAATPEAVDDCAWLARAWGLLRWHGQRTCRGRAPRCAQCVLEGDCPSSEA